MKPDSEITLNLNHVIHDKYGVQTAAEDKKFQLNKSYLNILIKTKCNNCQQTDQLPNHTVAHSELCDV